MLTKIIILVYIYLTHYKFKISSTKYIQIYIELFKYLYSTNGIFQGKFINSQCYSSQMSTKLSNFIISVRHKITIFHDTNYLLLTFEYLEKNQNKCMESYRLRNNHSFRSINNTIPMFLFQDFIRFLHTLVTYKF